MMPAQIIVEIAEEGGEIRLDSGRLKVKGVPARLVPLIREHKAALLALLSAPAPDDYAAEERLAIQEEGNEVSDHPGKSVPSLEEQAEKVLAHYGVDDLRIVARNPVLASHVEKMGIDATNTTTMQHSADMAPQSALCNSGPMVPILEKDRHGETVVRGFRLATQQPVRPSAPATITCGSCGEFEPGLEPEGLGRCSRTADGLPPVASRGYGVCFPHAPRTCPDYKEP